MFQIYRKDGFDSFTPSKLSPFKTPRAAGEYLNAHVNPANRTKYVVRRISDDEIADAHWAQHQRECAQAQEF